MIRNSINTCGKEASQSRSLRKTLPIIARCWLNGCGQWWLLTVTSSFRKHEMVWQSSSSSPDRRAPTASHKMWRGHGCSTKTSNFSLSLKVNGHISVWQWIIVSLNYIKIYFLTYLELYRAMQIVWVLFAKFLDEISASTTIQANVNSNICFQKYLPCYSG